MKHMSLYLKSWSSLSFKNMENFDSFILISEFDLSLLLLTQVTCWFQKTIRDLEEQGLGTSLSDNEELIRKHEELIIKAKVRDSLKKITENCMDFSWIHFYK